MEIESAVRRLLLSDPTVQGYVAGKVWRHRREENIEGTSGRAIVVGRNNGWATPDPVTSQEYPIVTLQFHADQSRINGEITALDAADKAWALYRATNGLLHNKRGVWWGTFGSNPGVMVVTSARWKEPVLVSDKDRHGSMIQGDPLGDTVYVYAEYAVQVIH